MPGAQGEFGELGTGPRGQDQVVPADTGFDAAGEPFQARAVLRTDGGPEIVRRDRPGPEGGQPGRDGRGPPQLPRVEPVGGGRRDEGVVGGGVFGGQADRAARFGKRVPPLPGRRLGSRRPDGDGHRAVGGPQGVPVLLPVRDQGCAAERLGEVAEQSGALGAFRGERFERAEDRSGPAEAHLCRQRPHEWAGFGVRGEGGDVDGQRPVAGRGQGRDREAVRIAAPVEQVHQPAAGAEDGRDPGDLGTPVGVRGGYGLPDGSAQPPVGLVVAEEVGRDPVGYAQQP